SLSKNDQTAHISLQIYSNVKKQRKENNPNIATLMAKSKPLLPRIFERPALQRQPSDPPQRLAASVKRYLGAGRRACKRKNARHRKKNRKPMIFCHFSVADSSR
ncbi:hypothetical protein, partial [Paracoccus denitrificans]|uniref:hypothetical protein n=1 Tax=Paracoccus denitrificans TaxID=266 RepID=UPI001F367D18